MRLDALGQTVTYDLGEGAGLADTETGGLVAVQAGIVDGEGGLTGALARLRDGGGAQLSLEDGVDGSRVQRGCR